VNTEPAKRRRARSDLSVGDPVVHKTRLLSEQCGTCIFRPGNLMHLEPGQLAQLVREAHDNAGYIICHDTLPYSDFPQTKPAICRGFADRYTTPALQIMALLWGFVEVDPPSAAD